MGSGASAHPPVELGVVRYLHHVSDVPKQRCWDWFTGRERIVFPLEFGSFFGRLRRRCLRYPATECVQEDARFAPVIVKRWRQTLAPKNMLLDEALQDGATAPYINAILEHESPSTTITAFMFCRVAWDYYKTPDTLMALARRMSVAELNEDGAAECPLEAVVQTCDVTAIQRFSTLAQDDGTGLFLSHAILQRFMTPERQPAIAPLFDALERITAYQTITLALLRCTTRLPSELVSLVRVYAFVLTRPVAV